VKTSLPHLGALALTALLACGDIAEHNAGRAYSMADLVRSGSVAPEVFTARGAPLTLLSPPFAATGSRQAADTDGLTVFPSFVDTRPAAYVTTEIWDEWSRVWAQPMYVPVTSVQPVDGPVRLAGSRPIFSVGPGSRFYSPYWEVWYVVVPASTRAALEALRDQSKDLAVAKLPPPPKADPPPSSAEVNCIRLRSRSNPVPASFIWV